MASSRLRVLLVTPDFPPEKGGIQIFLARLLQSFAGIDARVLTLRHAEAHEFDPGSGLDVRRVGGDRVDRRFAVLALNGRSLVEAMRYRPDVVVSGHVVASLGAMAIRRALRIPLVQYVHADEFRTRTRLAEAAVRSADATIAVSGYTGEMALEAGADPGRVHVIHPGIDLPDLPSRERSAVPTLLTVASLLFRYKGHDAVIRALPLIRARIPDARWVVIGDGPFRPAVEAAVAAYGLESAVELRGRVGDEERNGWLERANAFCMVSRLPAAGIGGEGFGIAYLEAAARCLPSIAGNVAGARDAVLDGKTGLLVDPTDHLAVAEAATALLIDPDRAAELGAAARLYAEEHSWPRIAASTEEVLREACGRGRSG
jgi:phosphatidyl-myo-inositol dimannoside synthase